MTIRPLPQATRLTRQQHEEIRRAYAAGGMTQKDIGKAYGVDQPVVSRIVNGKRRTISRAGA